MFTGLIQEIGLVKRAVREKGVLRLAIEAPKVSRELRVNDSVAVSGVCLTVVALAVPLFEVEVVEETLRKTTLSGWQAGQRVNLEPCVRLSDRLGGHLVQGHVDAVARVAGIRYQQGGVLLTLKLPPPLMKYVIPRGSIAVDGVSLTVARLNDNQVAISLIPHTLEHTTLSDLKPGDAVNIEVDLVGKYVERLFPHQPEPASLAWLHQLGYQDDERDPEPPL